MAREAGPHCSACPVRRESSGRNFFHSFSSMNLLSRVWLSLFFLSLTVNLGVNGQLVPVCGNAVLTPSEDESSLVMSWTCEETDGTASVNITNPTVANISVTVVDQTRQMTVNLTNADITILEATSISISGRYGQPMMGDDFLYRVSLSLLSISQEVKFSGRFALVTPTPPNGTAAAGQPIYILFWSVILVVIGFLTAAF